MKDHRTRRERWGSSCALRVGKQSSPSALPHESPRGARGAALPTRRRYHGREAAGRPRAREAQRAGAARRRQRRRGVGARARAWARAAVAVFAAVARGLGQRPGPRGRQHDARRPDPLVHAPVEVGVVHVVAPPRRVAPLQVVLAHVVQLGRVPVVRLDARAVDHRREALAAVRRPRDDEPAARLERVRVDVGLRRRVPVGGRRRVLLLRALLARHADGRQCSATRRYHAQAGALRLLVSYLSKYRPLAHAGAGD